MKLSTQIKIIDFINKHIPCFLDDFITRKFAKGTYLSQVEFHLVDHCNLNCAHCDHFTPLAKEYFADIEDIVNDFKKLKKIFDNIGKIYIVGGEPLLHPDLLKIFSPLRTLYPKSEIIIITNGILLDKQKDEFWEKLKEYDIALSMTHYPLNIDYLGYIEKCKNLGIKAYYFSLNRDKMQKMDLDIKGSRNKKRAFLKCTRKKCHFLRDGKLYVCTPAPNIRFLNEYFNLNFKLDKTDYIDLEKIKSASKINKLFKRPIEFCKYCNDEDLSYDKYRISKKELSEWVKS